jgi:DNA-binding GntR family transcriptional regulator
MSDTKILSTSDPAPARAASRADHVYYALRDDIFDMRLMPGDRVTEGGIAERFAVSRTPAREALQRLQSDGLMQGYVRGGWEVVPIDIKRFDDLYEMRQLIETFAVRKLCSAGASSPGLDSMLDALDAVWKVARKKRIGDGRALVGLDESFHHALVAAANNDELTSTMQRVTDRIRVVRRLDLVYGDSIGATYDEHVAILDAIRSRDIDTSVELIARHIQGSQAEVRALTVHRLQIARTDMVPDSVPYAPARLRRTI